MSGDTWGGWFRPLHPVGDADVPDDRGEDPSTAIRGLRPADDQAVFAGVRALQRAARPGVAPYSAKEGDEALVACDADGTVVGFAFSRRFGPGRRRVSRVITDPRLARTGLPERLLAELERRVLLARD